jgi:hypothetical protein
MESLSAAALGSLPPAREKNVKAPVDDWRDRYSADHRHVEHPNHDATDLEVPAARTSV